MEATMIDRARLIELKQEIGEEDFAEVAAIFLDEMIETLTRLCADPASAQAADFHALRGSALNLGFADLALACTEAEHKAHEGKAVDMVRIDWLFHESLAAFGPDLPRPEAA